MSTTYIQYSIEQYTLGKWYTYLISNKTLNEVKDLLSKLRYTYPTDRFKLVERTITTKRTEKQID